VSYIDNILAVFDSADEQAVREGTEWYSAMAVIMREHSRLSGYSVAQCAAVYAANSINTPWTRNLALAASAIDNRGMSNGTLGMVIRKVNAILQGSDIDSTLSKDKNNLKLKNFYRNLSGDFDAVTVDRWAHRVATNGEKSNVPTGKLYNEIADAYRTAAAMRGVTPAAMQAITWVVMRGSAN
jgi:hypothetical protein